MLCPIDGVATIDGKDRWIGKHMERRGATLGDVPTARLPRVDVGGQKTVFVLAVPAGAGEDFVSGEPGRIVVPEGPSRGKERISEPGLPAVPKVVPVARRAEPVEPDAIGRASAQEQRPLLGLARRQRREPEGAAVAADALDRHRPCGVVPVETEREGHCRGMFGRGAAVRRVERIGALRQFRRVGDAVPVRVGSSGVRPRDGLLQNGQAVFVRVLVPGVEGAGIGAEPDFGGVGDAVPLRVVPERIRSRLPDLGRVRKSVPVRVRGSRVGARSEAESVVWARIVGRLGLVGTGRAAAACKRQVRFPPLVVDADLEGQRLRVVGKNREAHVHGVRGIVAEVELDAHPGAMPSGAESAPRSVGTERIAVSGHVEGIGQQVPEADGDDLLVGKLPDMDHRGGVGDVIAPRGRDRDVGGGGRPGEERLRKAARAGGGLSGRDQMDETVDVDGEAIVRHAAHDERKGEGKSPDLLVRAGRASGQHVRSGQRIEPFERFRAVAVSGLL